MKDEFQRNIDYLRLSLTDACNLRCAYCKKHDGKRSFLEMPDIMRLLPAFREAGIKKIRLTGGEPLLHPDISRIVRACYDLKFEDIAITTNALLLNEKASNLRENGLNRVNISLNSLNPENYRRITGVDGLQRVYEGIDAAEKAGFDPIKINTVLMRGKNDREICDFIMLAKEKPYQIRFIEYMSMGADINDDIRITQDEIINKFPNLKPHPEEDTPTVQIYRAEGYAGTIGFISPVSKPFCMKCTRLRVTSALTLRPCLGSNDEIDLRTAISDGRLQQVIAQAIKEKPSQGFCCGFITERPMSEIGG